MVQQAKNAMIDITLKIIDQELFLKCFFKGEETACDQFNQNEHIFLNKSVMRLRLL